MKPDYKQNPENSVKYRVLSEINQQAVEPKPGYVFWCKNGGMWALWLATVVLGAFATAVLIFTTTYQYYDIYHAIDGNVGAFLIDVLPALWIGAFIALMLVAMRGLRATTRGYRLSPWLIIGSSVGLSVLFGSLLSMSSFGFWLDNQLGDRTPMYTSQAEREKIIWQQPANGRLVATDAARIGTSTKVMVVDSAGANWIVETVELTELDQELLVTVQPVRILGRVMTADSNIFHACGVFPWLLHDRHSRRELSQQKRQSMAKMNQHYKRGDKTELEQFETIAFDNADPNGMPAMRVCAEIAAVRNMAGQNR